MKISELFWQMYNMPMNEALTKLSENKDNIESAANIMSEITNKFPSVSDVNLENIWDFQSLLMRLYELM